jgi:catechol 2,3-dioxygenase-like lactoylglutathione lyase family enzyme
MSLIENSVVTVMVSDMDASIRFYTETLGLLLKNRYGNHWADIEGPGIAIGLHPASKEIKKGDNVSIGFRVKDLDKAIAAFTEKGVQFKKQNDSQVKLAHFTDPDNNAFYLAQPEW